MGIAEVMAAALNKAEKLKDVGAGNEANTKALLIDPLLTALGWDLGDVEVVAREVKVFDGTFLDYSLTPSSGPRLFVEAKGIGENLGDKKFIAQTINYANNDGVVWCVLTNGLQYRVFKTNEPVAMDKKLLFEVDLRDPDPIQDKVRLLRLIGRESAETGALTAYGDRVFTDTRVRRALSELATDPPAPLLEMLGERLGHPSVPVDGLRRSLERILDGRQASPTNEGRLEQHGKRTASSGPVGPRKGQEYPLDHHFSRKSSLIRELWEALDSFGESLGADVTRRVRKQYIGYYRGKRSFFTAEVQKGRVLVYLSLTRETALPWNDTVMRDVAEIGHFGMGGIEYSLVTVEQLNEVQALIKRAYGD
ncbi:DUF5655 domain-containing protein [Flexivirga lutea]